MGAPNQPAAAGAVLAPLALAAALLLAACSAGGGEESPPVATAGAGAASAAGAPEREAPPLGDAPLPGPAGEGFVVWESNRGGAWRIWSVDLAPGATPRRLSPEEPGRVHCCPHLSPDGTRLAYLSLPPGGEAYEAAASTGPLHLLDLATGADRVVVGAARTYFENRAVVWRGDGELVYIAGDGRTMLVDLATGAARRLTDAAAEQYGWLIDPALAFATRGWPAFSPYDPATRSILERPTIGGCQPYFSGDGRWGYWVAGAGGPINRVDLASGEVSTLLRKNDPRTVDGYGYAYFPMFSADRRAFAWAASAGEHSHLAADYEIFVAAADPARLELVGAVRRITRHPATDRFPDVHLAPLPLGSHDGEQPLTVELRAPGGGWRWSFGDGSTGDGAVGRHVYRQPGVYRVEARRGDEVLAGAVRVRPARAPRPLRVETTAAGREVRVTFDEEVAAAEARIVFASGLEPASWSLSSDRRQLVVDLAEPLARFDRLELAGIRDRAEPANAMEPVVLDVEPPLWPVRRDPVFLWRNAAAPNLIPDPASGGERSVVLTASGRAFHDREQRMVLRGGRFAASDEDSNRLRWVLQGSNEMALELTVEPVPPPVGAGGDAESPLVVFGRHGQAHNFALLQRGDRLVYSQKVLPRGAGMHARFDLGRLPPGRRHLVLSYSPGRLTLDVDGERVVETDAVQGDFFHWRSLVLSFGSPAGADPAAGELAWQGAIEGVALYDRALDAAESRESYRRYQRLLERRVVPPRLVVEARLVGRTPTPSLADIRPYREALAVHEYQVERLVDGPVAPPGPLRVAHWELLDGARQPASERRVGDRVTLRLEPFADQPQLAGLFVANRFESPPAYFALDGN